MVTFHGLGRLTHLVRDAPLNPQGCLRIVNRCNAEAVPLVHYVGLRADIHACVWVILLWLPALFLGASPRDRRPRGNDVRRPLRIDLKIAAKRDRRCRPALHSSTHLVHRRRRHVRLSWCVFLVDYSPRTPWKRGAFSYLSIYLALLVEA